MKKIFISYKVIIIILLLVDCLLGYKLHIANANCERMIQENENQKSEIEYLKKNLDRAQEKLYNLLEDKKQETDNSNVSNIEDNQSYYIVNIKTTAYSVGDGFTPGDIMADGSTVFVGAVAYNDVPLGTKLEIDGIIYTVCDRVGSDGVVDIYMNTVDECEQYGVQYKDVKIYL